MFSEANLQSSHQARMSSTNITWPSHNNSPTQLNSWVIEKWSETENVACVFHITADNSTWNLVINNSEPVVTFQVM